jgi:hypothetical protein
MRFDTSPDKIEEQIGREETQRATALGRRFALAQDGHLGPVISRWINASVLPVAQRTRLCAEAYCAGDMSGFGHALDTRLFGLAHAYDAGSPEYLEPILRWCLKGSSPGRSGQAGDITFCEDLVLSVIGRVISDLATKSLPSRGAQSVSEGADGISLAQALNYSAAAARETALGQFITMVQGAGAMAQLRRGHISTWAQQHKMRTVAGFLGSQVRHALAAEAKGELALEHVGSRTIVRVINPATPGTDRRVSLKAGNLTEMDWRLLNLAVHPKGAEDPARNAWLTFAMLVLCAAQREHGWFDLVDSLSDQHQKRSRPMRKTRYLCLSEKPKTKLKADLVRWTEMGFVYDPMIVPPEDGSYLTVKLRAVTGKPGPNGWKTHAEGTDHWRVAGEVMASTPWAISKDTLLEALDGVLTPLVAKEIPEEQTRLLILGAYQKDSWQDEIYLPLYMDFRGRLYTRTTWVSYQGTDLQKGLLHFPNRGVGDPLDDDAIALHVSGLLGMDKKALPERVKFFKDLHPGRDAAGLIARAEEPTQLWTALTLLAEGTPDKIALQIDGTCNGLQHLSAMFRDEDAAPWVNLAPAGSGETPSDLYMEVAGEASTIVALKAAAGEAWAMRLQTSGAVITRATVKRPVMVLPYGGTMIAIEEGVTDGLLSQDGINARCWKECLKTLGELDSEAIAGGYLAFADRPLGEHPLFRRDVQKLAKVVYDAIKRVIPKAMSAMDAFRAIAGNVGERSLEWSNGFGESPLWVVHAYAKTARRTNIFRGFHLPNSVRGLAMKCGRDEVYPAMHRTGIVANFIHSQDAAHLAETMSQFQRMGGTTFGANHDCLYTRPSEILRLRQAVRGAFALRYLGDPLANPVRLRDKERVETFPSWYALAESFGVEFPEMGKWDPTGVMKSFWFFS